LPILVGSNAPVFVGLQRGIGIEPRGAPADVRLGLQRGLQSRRVRPELALERLERRDVPQDRLAFGLPGGVAWVNIGEVPGGRRRSGRSTRRLCEKTSRRRAGDGYGGTGQQDLAA